MSLLLDRINQHKYRMAAEFVKGLEILLDLTPTDDQEYFIFRRTTSLLKAKIELNLSKRSIEDSINGLLDRLNSKYESSYKAKATQLAT